MNHSSSRDPVAGVAPGKCPRCDMRLGFGTDSNGSAVERCDCGYRAFVRVRIVAEPPVEGGPVVGRPGGRAGK